MHISEFGPVIIMISREEIERGDIEAPLSTLRRFIADAETAREMFERVDIAFHGYNDDAREVFEILEVRDYVRRLDDAFPFWLYFLTKQGLGLQAITLCLMPAYLTEEGKAAVFPERLESLMNKRWWPAMNQLCEATAFTEPEIEELTERVISYITEGPLPG